jgi:TolB protein
VWVMNGDGSGLTQLTDNGSDFEDGAPAWSPGGDRIAFHRFGLLATDDTPGSPSGLWVMNADGSDPRSLVEFTDLTVNDIVWSPDGEWIAFAYGSFESNVEVWVVPAGGGQAVNVSNLPGNDAYITWSPDSRAVLFTDATDDTTGLYYAAIDGSDTHAVFEDETTAYAAWMP